MWRTLLTKRRLYSAVNEPGEQCHCNACACDLTHTIRIVCADPVCMESEEGVDLCPPCFCAGKEFGLHKRGHAYRVVVRVCNALHYYALADNTNDRSSIHIPYSQKIGEQMSMSLPLRCVLIKRLILLLQRTAASQRYRGSWDRKLV